MKSAKRQSARRRGVARDTAVGVWGFTLIELLVVVTLIGLIAAIALPRFTGARRRAHRTQAITDLRSLVTAQEAYWSDAKVYADNISQLTQFNQTPQVIITILETTGNGWSAQATHNSDSNIKCAFYTGPVAPPAIAGIKEGIVHCES